MTDSDFSASRRKFVTRSLAAAAALPILSNVEGGVRLAWAEPTTAIDESNPKAVSFGYQHDAAKVDTTKWPKRAGAEGAKQFCNNCQLLVKAGVSAEGKEGKWGVCTLFPEGLVAEGGWCNMWVPKVG